MKKQINIINLTKLSANSSKLKAKQGKECHIMKIRFVFWPLIALIIFSLTFAEENNKKNMIPEDRVDMEGSITQEMLEKMIKSVPMNRLGRTEELGNLAVFLASEESKYITGQEIVIDGGNIIQEIKISESIDRFKP